MEKKNEEFTKIIKALDECGYEVNEIRKGTEAMSGFLNILIKPSDKKKD